MTDGILDTNIVIDLLSQDSSAVTWINQVSSQRLAITPIVWLETIEGARNKTERDRAIKFLHQFHMEHPTPDDNRWAMRQLARFSVSHGIQFPDVMIASVAVRLSVPLYTLNIRHYAPCPPSMNENPIRRECMIALEHTTIKTNGVNLHVVQAGPEDRPLVILLHGFPEFWYGWRKQIDYLAEQGFRVWAPDQRGYNISDKPKGAAAYSLDVLSEDVLGLIDAAGKEKACVVGHDLGAAVAWWTANKTPERLDKMVILNVPHHSVFRKAVATSWAQRRKSWYFYLFRLPWLPEKLIGMNQYKTFAGGMQRNANPGSFSDADMEEYRKAWAQPGAMIAMLNWYRAIFSNPPARLPNPRISVPTLMLWGKQDIALGAEMAQPSIDLCDNGRLVFFENATHWVEHDEAEAVNKLIAEFLLGKGEGT